MPATKMLPAEFNPAQSNPGYFEVGGTTMAVNAVSDGLDTTWVRRLGGMYLGGGYASFGSIAIPAAADITHLVPGARLSDEGGPTFDLNTAAALLQSFASYTGWGAVPATLTQGVCPATSLDDATAHTVDSLASPWLGISNSDINTHGKWYDLWLWVYSLTRPTVSALSVAGGPALTTTNAPIVSATLSAVFEAWRNVNTMPALSGTVQIRVFTAAQVAVGGFDAATAAPQASADVNTAALSYGDGTTPTTVTAAATMAALPNGTYKVYARAKLSDASCRYGAWTTYDLTINITPSPAPTLAATTDQAAQRVAIVVTPNQGAGHTAPTFSVERSADAGATWTPLAAATDLPGTYAVASTIHDYMAPRGVALSYRARVTDTMAGYRMSTSWATAAATAIAASGWNLKFPAMPSLNLINALVAKDPGYKQDEDIGVFRARTRRRAIVVHGVLGGIDGSMTIIATDAATWAAIVALREAQQPIYLESPFGWARWVEITSRSWEELNAAAAAKRPLKLDYVEVDAP